MRIIARNLRRRLRRAWFFASPRPHSIWSTFSSSLRSSDTNKALSWSVEPAFGSQLCETCAAPAEDGGVGTSTSSTEGIDGALSIAGILRGRVEPAIRRPFIQLEKRGALDEDCARL